MERNTALVIIGALTALTIMVTVAVLSGIDTGLVTGGVGAVVSILGAVLGLKGGEVLTKRKVIKFFEELGSSESAEEEPE